MVATATDATPRHQPRPHRLLGAARQHDPAPRGQVVLPLSSADRVPRGAPSVVRARPQREGLLLADHLVVADPQKWRISSLRTDPRIGGYLVPDGHPALLHPGPGSVARLPRIPVNDGVDLAVEYVGAEDLGEPLVACLCAVPAAASSADLGAPGDPGDDRPAGSRGRPAADTVVFAERAAPRGARVRLAMPDQAHDLDVSDLVLGVEDPTHWSVSDLLVGDDTLFVDSGAVPGELLAAHPGRAALRLGRVRAGEGVVVEATYTGPEPSALLTYTVYGTTTGAGEAPAGDVALLPMSSGVEIASDADIHTRVGLPAGYAFAPEEIVLRDADRWVVLDVKVGVRSQLAQSGDVPGAVLGVRARGARLHLDAVPGGGVSLVLGIRPYSTAQLGGAVVCGAVGRVVQLPSPR